METRSSITESKDLLPSKHGQQIRNQAQQRVHKLETGNDFPDNNTTDCCESGNESRNIKVEEEDAKVEVQEDSNISKSTAILPQTIISKSKEPHVVCKLCLKPFMRDYIKKHERSHMPYAQRNKFKCSSCDKHYLSNRDLVRHSQIHLPDEEIRKYDCSLCDKSFKRRGGLKDHQKTHLPDSERIKYSCSVCDKSFKWMKHLHRHSRTHSKNTQSNTPSTL